MSIFRQRLHRGRSDGTPPLTGTRPAARNDAWPPEVAYWQRRLAQTLDARADGAPATPCPEIDAKLLRPYFESVGFQAPPDVTFAQLRDSGWPVYATRADAEAMVELVLASGLFDGVAYAAHRPEDWCHLDPALHYVLVGERLGFSPSSAFDPAYYAEINPDVVAAGWCLLGHYSRYGCAEGRRALPLAAGLMEGASHYDLDKPTIIVVSHQTSRTGAPILALNIAERLARKYNVVTILLRDDELTERFERISAQHIVIADPLRNPIELKYAVRKLAHEHPVRYAIVNSFESRPILPALAEAFVPSLTLIHEFASYAGPLGSARLTLGWTTEPVFSTDLTADSFCDAVPSLVERRIHVLPQGRCTLPVSSRAADLEAERARLTAAMRPPGDEDAFIVLGAGSVHLRKGVDLFLATAAATLRLPSKRRMRFVWIGDGYRPADDMSYSIYLAEQISRSGLAGHVVFLDPVSDLEAAYALTDAFYLPSRLDALPNVTIDAAMHGLPVICFEGATGIAEILQRDPLAATTAMPHLDAAAAAHRLIELANDEDLCKSVGNATQELAQKIFDMDAYVATLDEIGSAAMRVMEQRRADFETLLVDPTFDVKICSSCGEQTTRGSAISRFLAYWSAARLAPNQIQYLDLRRPCPGFNPQIYAYHHPELVRAEINPFADFLRNGRPDGPWVHPVIRLDQSAANPPDYLRTAIHAHFHYPDLIEDFLAKLATNQAPCDLLLSTTDEEKADALASATRDFSKGRVEIRVGPNRGRDIAPFLMTYAVELKEYDVVGHLHAKRSLHAHESLGERWREFLWQHLLGGLCPAMDIALTQFGRDERLGLLFAEEPHLCDWSSNLHVALMLADRCGITKELPPFFEFPVGTMFWARPAALAPILELKLKWHDYPEEPVPIDGTVLHAIERLLPFAARAKGFDFATTHIPGITW